MKCILYIIQPADSWLEYKTFDDSRNHFQSLMLDNSSLTPNKGTVSVIAEWTHTMWISFGLPLSHCDLSIHSFFFSSLYPFIINFFIIHLSTCFWTFYLLPDWELWVTVLYVFMFKSSLSICFYVILMKPRRGLLDPPTSKELGVHLTMKNC